VTKSADRWVLASDNQGKLAEIQSLLADTGIEVVAQGELGLSSPEETGSTFVENAICKARHAAFATSLPAIADDSGLAVDALSGAPGIRSARYAGDDASDAENVDKLLSALVDLPAEQRQARFHCVLVAMRSGNDPAPVIAHGDWRGEIAFNASGSNGFGYDPIFYVPGLGATAAELPYDVKNRLSHRGQAHVKLVAALVNSATGIVGKD
jgi:XTP/dITP diphosphohydrolase